MQDIIARMRTKKDDEGFTLIELLVVVVIIGVLVAIAVPVYLNYRQGAADKSAQSDVRGAISAVEQYFTDNGNVYPVLPADTDVKTASFHLGNTTGSTGLVTLSENTQMRYFGTTTKYTICATNKAGSGKVYVYNSTAGGSVKPVSTISELANCSIDSGAPTS
ncbi:prepilin-type N-terminal cleavage/methylation domain-containing protein [Actinoplanes sp. RD1]|uniref:prepilin-type N-terminal cleavage/methylation domain-containing protein n=1 Tax=Actinoplanes sp. RD1 TaxID=3064538 RepID=UPI002741FCE9|nr:prepilin-type N-terminal cleavage/methylation domain-containing protein [Actinoplanes sp. RD1]